MAETTHGLNRSATDTAEDAGRKREREKNGRRLDGNEMKKGKRKRNRTYRCTGAAYAPVGRASIHDNGHGASVARAYARPIGARELLRADLIAAETYD